MGDIDGKKIVDYVLPAAVGGELAGVLRCAADKIQSTLADDNIADKLPVKQFTPGEGEINLLGGKKRFFHFPVLFHDLNIVNAIGTPPKLEINVAHLPGVRGDFIQTLIDCMANGVGG